MKEYKDVFTECCVVRSAWTVYYTSVLLPTHFIEPEIHFCQVSLTHQRRLRCFYLKAANEYFHYVFPFLRMSHSSTWFLYWNLRVPVFTSVFYKNRLIRFLVYLVHVHFLIIFHNFLMTLLDFSGSMFFSENLSNY